MTHLSQLLEQVSRNRSATFALLLFALVACFNGEASDIRFTGQLAVLVKAGAPITEDVLVRIRSRIDPDVWFQVCARGCVF